MKLLRQNKNSLLIVLIVLCILPGLWSLFHPGFFVSDDGSWMIIRFSAFYDNVRHFQFPVRFLSRLNFGYGYPVADFLYPLFMYLGIPIKIIGFNFINTIKIIFGASLLFSAIFSFFWLRKKFSQVASAIGAISYALFPYYIWDIYKRGSVGEVLALCIVPFILWQIERQSMVFVALGIGFLITSHNVMALFFLPVSIIYAFISRKLTVREIIVAAILGLSLSAFFWLPALWDKQYTIFDTVSVSNISDYFLNPQSYTLFGFIAVLAVIHSFLIKKKGKEYIFFLLLAIFSIIFTLPLTKMLWEIFPGKNLIQFPFRLLSLTTLSTGFLVAYNIDHLGKKIFIGAFFYLIIIYASCWIFLSPASFVNYPNSYYATNVDSTTVKNEYMPKWVKEFPKTMPREKIQILSKLGTIRTIEENPNKILFSLSTNTQATIQVNTIYFPGWRVSVNGKPYPFSYDNPFGVMSIKLPAGTSLVLVQFGETIVRLFADGISIVAIGTLIGLFFLKRNKRYLQ